MGYNNNDIGGEYAKSGSMSVKVFKETSVPGMAAQYEYGHTQLALDPSVNFSATGTSIDISFSWYVNTEKAIYKYVSL